MKVYRVHYYGITGFTLLYLKVYRVQYLRYSILEGITGFIITIEGIYYRVQYLKVLQGSSLKGITRFIITIEGITGFNT